MLVILAMVRRYSPCAHDVLFTDNLARVRSPVHGDSEKSRRSTDWLPRMYLCFYICILIILCKRPVLALSNSRRQLCRRNNSVSHWTCRIYLLDPTPCRGQCE
jgi:hypothetical protein